MSMSALGFPCPECGHEEQNVTARILSDDEDRFDIGMVLHCPKCEKVWETILFPEYEDRRYDSL